MEDTPEHAAKGGLNTKIHAVVNARSQPIVIALSSGEPEAGGVAPLGL